MNDSSGRRTTAWASDRRTRDAPLAYARCAVDCMDGANVREAVEAAVANLLCQSAPLTIFTSPARKTFVKSYWRGRFAARHEPEFDRESKNEDRFLSAVHWVNEW